MTHRTVVVVACLAFGASPAQAEDPWPLPKAVQGLEQARVLCESGHHARAETLFRQLAEDRLTPAAIAEQARFGEADALRLQGHYVRAAAAYQRVLADFPEGALRPQANARLFGIANYWLDDTREEMAASREHPARPRSARPKLVHLDPTKPRLDEEGAALRLLGQVCSNDPGGPLAAKARFFLGSVHFYRQRYVAAARHLVEVADKHPRDPLAPGALKLAVVALVQGVAWGTDDEGRLAEARNLVGRLRRDYPGSVTPEFLTGQEFIIDSLEASGTQSD